MLPGSALIFIKIQVAGHKEVHWFTKTIQDFHQLAGMERASMDYTNSPLIIIGSVQCYICPVIEL